MSIWQWNYQWWLVIPPELEGIPNVYLAKNKEEFTNKIHIALKKIKMILKKSQTLVRK